MPFNGSGVYTTPTNSWSPAVTATTISSTDWESLRADLQTALSTAICKDGQTTVTANLPMATYRHMGGSNATALTQYATADQVVDNSLVYGGASAAGTDTYAVNLAISPGAYAAGQRYSFKADVANTGSCTINFNTIGAASIKLQDGQDPYNNAIIAGQIVELIYDGTNMLLLNPYTGGTMLRVSLSGSQSYDSSSDATVFFDTESSDMPDTFSEFNTGTYTFTAAKAGFYYTKVSIYCTSLSIASSFALRVFKNGTTNAIAMEDTNITSNGNRDLSGVIYLAASDTLTVEGPSVGANTMTISGTDVQTFWEIYRIR